MAFSAKMLFSLKFVHVETGFALCIKITVICQSLSIVMSLEV